MENKKLSVAEFDLYKDKLRAIIKRAENLAELKEKDSNAVPDNYEEKLLKEYYQVQTEMLNFDLSDIPFDNWQDVEVLNDVIYPVDFSKSKANIDFEIIPYSKFANYKNCKIKNFSSLLGVVDSDAFDEEVIKNNSQYFLPDFLSNELKRKFYYTTATVEDLLSLSSDQIKELESKKIENGFEYLTKRVIDQIGLDTAVKLYSLSKDDYKAVYDIAGMFSSYGDNFRDEIEGVELTEIKNIYYSKAREKYTEKNLYGYPYQLLPKQFIEENPDIFLLNENIPDDLRQRYYDKMLTTDDVLENISLFKSVPVLNFISYSDEHIFGLLTDSLEPDVVQRAIELYPKHFKYIIKGNASYSFSSFVNIRKSLDSSLPDDLKEKIMEYITSYFAEHNKLENGDQLMLYEPSLFSLDEKQKRVVDFFGLENIQRFEQETNFFSHKRNAWSSNLETFDAFSSYFQMINHKMDKLIGENKSNITYDEFKNKLAASLKVMKNANVFSDFPDYRWLTGEFRDNHPEIFLSEDAPDELQDYFYRNRLTPKGLLGHPEYIPFLLGKDVENVVKAEIKLNAPGLLDENGSMIPSVTDFAKEYISRYGEEKYLQLFTKYGSFLSNLSIDSFNKEIDSEEQIEKSIRKSIYKKISFFSLDYSYLLNIPEMVEEYPDIFVDFEAIMEHKLEGTEQFSLTELTKLKEKFYQKKLSYSDVRKYPFLKETLKDKSLMVIFENLYDSCLVNDRMYSDVYLLDIYGNEKFLDLCSKYGRYLEGNSEYLYKNTNLTIDNGKFMKFDKELSFEELQSIIEQQIAESCLNGNINYTFEDAPDFLKQSHPELFLSEDAPDLLKLFFYNKNNSYPMNFELLKENKEWMQFLEGKSIKTALLRNFHYSGEIEKFFDLFGEKAMSLGINRAETVQEMVKTHEVGLMKQWYDKTGGKFIPDFVVMQNFDINEADKFLISGANWSNLMKIKGFSSYSESRDAMLKLAYCFGAFDQDQVGMKKLQELLTGIPRKYKKEDIARLQQMEQEIIKYNKILSSSSNGEVVPTMPLCALEYGHLKEELEKSGYNFTGEEILNDIFNIDSDMSATLKLNPQSYTKAMGYLRTILEEQRIVLDGDQAHQLFGGFSLKYDKDFREFLLNNLDEIRDKPEYTKYISNIQKQFDSIKAFNSNRALTLDLAVSFVQLNKYVDVNVGNDKVAEISAIAGYSQDDFNTLQQIYNYGKTRTFNSIPRIDKATSKYRYEMLRLDDPLAMAIGTLTDCCQQIGDCAEVCMEHSMVDKNGRVFVIKDDKGNIVAQSWVWRNRDVLCFDNIEIPDKAFVRATKEDEKLGRKGFTDEIYGIYKQAAKDLIEADEVIYKELLDNGKITQEQYEGLRLGKVTVGLGYNDIAESLKNNSSLDKGIVARPLPFKEPVKLSRGLYTRDSSSQYVLEERDDRKTYDGVTLPVHTDSIVEYTNDNFDKKMLLMLEKLELVTKHNPNYMETRLSDYDNKERIVSSLARNYNLNPQTTRIVMNPNFAMIYDINGENMKIGDLLYNFSVDNGQQQMDITEDVLLQMKLAFDQILADRTIDISDLDEEQKEIYEKVIGLTDEIDKGRGVGHAR